MSSSMSFGRKSAPSTIWRRCGRRFDRMGDGQAEGRWPLELAYGPCVSSRMRIVVAAVGRLKQGPERELAERYRKRASDAGRSAGLSAFDIVEIKESRAGDATRRMLEESIAIANIVP